MLEQVSLLLNQMNSLFEDREKQLEEAEGSCLAARFNGLWEQCLDHDDQGRIFLDFDPYCFQLILFYLRSRTLLSSAEATATLPEVEPCKRRAFLDLVKYLALEEYMGHMGSGPVQFVQGGSGVQLTQNGQVAKAIGSGASYRTVLTGSHLGNVCFCKCKFHQVGQWVFLGVGADLAVDAHDNHSAATAHGWAMPDRQFTTGSMSSATVSWANGDWVLVKADFSARKLSMVSSRASTPLTMPLEVPANLQDQYVFQVILWNCRDHVELLPVNAEDQQLLP
ncbi:MAG: hypothetical protein FRX49_04345 [Trebouxia sp. A1-2]|nr:MAG: hypothetical protein FRX49_04345 [Trebouxia sp. A1-2]